MIGTTPQSQESVSRLSQAQRDVPVNFIGCRQAQGILCYIREISRYVDVERLLIDTRYHPAVNIILTLP